MLIMFGTINMYEEISFISKGQLDYLCPKLWEFKTD